MDVDRDYENTELHEEDVDRDYENTELHEEDGINYENETRATEGRIQGEMAVQSHYDQLDLQQKDDAIYEDLRTAQEAISERNRCKIKKYTAGGLFCAFSGTVLLGVATVTNNWVQFKVDDTHHYQGIWKELRCKGTACFTGDIPDIYVMPLIAMGIILILLGILCVFGILIGITSYAQKLKPLYVVGITFFFSSATVALIMVIYSSVAATNLSLMVTGRWGFSWSYLLCWMASVLILFAGILSIRAHRINKQESKRRADVSTVAYSMYPGQFNVLP